MDNIKETQYDGDEYGNGPSGFIKGGDFLDQLSDYYHLWLCSTETAQLAEELHVTWSFTSTAWPRGCVD